MLGEITDFCDALLDAGSIDDYCPNGLQVEGRQEVRKIVSGVTACQALVDAAVAAGADLVLVHHGYFWRGEPAPLVGIKGRRVASLMRAGISLLAYHLPLDAHAEVGNNRQLGLRLGYEAAAPVADLLWGIELDRPESPGGLGDRLRELTGREPQRVGPARGIRRVCWCTGAAQGRIELAAALGYDAFISGEISEQTFHQAHELDIAYFAAGHHATERYGVQALGAAIARRFGVEHCFIDIDNPV